MEKLLVRYLGYRHVRINLYLVRAFLQHSYAFRQLLHFPAFGNVLGSHSIVKPWQIRKVVFLLYKKVLDECL